MLENIKLVHPLAKVCPFVEGIIDHELYLLAFRHPIAGCQFVKGSIEQGEAPLDAAQRELKEESGLTITAPMIFFGRSCKIVERQEWFFFKTRLNVVRRNWVFYAPDDGGHDFDFFWHDLKQPLDQNWHVSFHRAFDFYKFHNS